MEDMSPTQHDEEVSQMYEEDMNPPDPTPIEPPLEDQEEEYVHELNRLRDLAYATLEGKFGIGDKRRELLGKDYDQVMQIVTEIRTSK